MFGPSVKVNKALLERLKQMASESGSPSVNELVIRILEREVAQFENGAGEREQIKKRLQGLGYID